MHTGDQLANTLARMVFEREKLFNTNTRRIERWSAGPLVSQSGRPVAHKWHLIYMRMHRVLFECCAAAGFYNSDHPTLAQNNHVFYAKKSAHFVSLDRRSASENIERLCVCILFAASCWRKIEPRQIPWYIVEFHRSKRADQTNKHTLRDSGTAGGTLRINGRWPIDVYARVTVPHTLSLHILCTHHIHYNNTIYNAWLYTHCVFVSF